MFSTARDLVDAAGGLTDAGLETSEQIEALTDEPATPAYDVLTADELNELITRLKPIATRHRPSTTEHAQHAPTTPSVRPPSEQGSRHTRLRPPEQITDEHRGPSR